MDPSPERQTAVFVVRIWQEAALEPERQQWRGQIEQVQTGDKSYFQISNAILQLLVGYLRAANAGGSEGHTGMEK